MARVALVTGGTRGIGAAIAKRLKNDGYTVVVVDVVDEQIAKFKEETGIPGYKLDVSDTAAVQATFKQIEADVGPIDVLVNNAGITRDARMVKMTRERNWDPVIGVNLTGVFNTTQAALPGMTDRKWGRVINISSMNGQRGQFGQTNYSATKAGMIGFSRSVALECANKNVTVNCIAPGFILTEMTGAMPKEILDGEVAKIPAGRIGQPSDIAAGVAFLASDDAAFITGMTLSINGGQFMP
ncbi:beta-ketoacyl-ACP reductase [Defluviicoccus vanus]|uniref:Beta-ketoacyl-ACP reductase n=1 Tax=Defluviicoccus vanus TaxID=111831 RepID=A0A7H1N061_9PROT|nr:beta-ketoacyl-ACP reductase [Defluviicoccus vanus]QNT69097.1 beta-ketoacyl-ACP reductase [Defluviicoccus vanus]